MDFIDEIKQFSKRVDSLKDNLPTEEATKTSLIMPFFSLLGYDVFNQQAMSPGEGQQVTVVIKEGASAYKVGKTLEQKGLIKDAAAFVVQERMSAYHGQIKAGTYLLSTAYTPTRIIAVLSGEESEEGSNSQ